MKSTKHQYPSPRETPITEHQTRPSSPDIRHPSWSLKFGASLVLGCWCLVLPASAQFSIDWFKIAGGGGASTGGLYAVSGTIGQPDASGPLTKDQYSITGGFWSLLSVTQTPGSPLLSIALTATNTAMISWPSPSIGFSLQQNTNGIASVNWSNVVATPTDNGTIKYVIINPPTGNRFYRLVHP